MTDQEIQQLLDEIKTRFSRDMPVTEVAEKMPRLLAAVEQLREERNQLRGRLARPVKEVVGRVEMNAVD